MTTSMPQSPSSGHITYYTLPEYKELYTLDCCKQSVYTYSKI